MTFRMTVFRTSTIIASLAALLVVIPARTVIAGDLDVYSTNDQNSTHNMPPDGGGNGWTQAPASGANKGEVTAPAFSTFWLAFRNDPIPGKKKWFKVTITAVDGTDTRPRHSETKGFSGSNDNAVSPGTMIGYKSSGRNVTLKYRFEEQPQWERVTLLNLGGPQTYKVSASSFCCTTEPAGFNVLNVRDGSFGAPDAMSGEMRVTEVAVFPVFADVDQGVIPEFDAPQETGVWESEFTFVDPFGRPRPRGGVRFFTAGPGITVNELWNMSVTMTDTPYGLYRLFYFDDDLGEWIDYIFDLGTLPWQDDFDDPEIYPVGEGVIGERGWKGWDDNPELDGFVTDTVRHSTPSSLGCAGTADLVRQFALPSAEEGLWAFTAWQYIPADFQNGGGGQWRGSHFILLDTYQDGGPYHWAVDLQADSVTGNMRIYHGDGTNSIQIPYETDRWVKIQVLVDLDSDWTSIYYDDALITEYLWTGGILGDGGGALDIAAVDLFANGSTPIYYDDLRLQRVDLESEPESLEMVTGVILSGGLDELREVDGNVLTTRSGFGESLIDLHHTEYIVTMQTPQAEPFDALRISVDTSIDHASGNGKIGLLNRHTQRIDWLPMHSIGLQPINWTSAWITSYEPYLDGNGEVEVHVYRVVHVPFLAFTFETYDDRLDLFVRGPIR